MKGKNFDETIKILMLGESGILYFLNIINSFPGVGKSSILTRFVDDKFSTNFITTLGLILILSPNLHF